MGVGEDFFVLHHSAQFCTIAGACGRAWGMEAGEPLRRKGTKEDTKKKESKARSETGVDGMGAPDLGWALSEGRVRPPVVCRSAAFTFKCKDTWAEGMLVHCLVQVKGK
jgi:hypothetical protein